MGLLRTVNEDSLLELQQDNVFVVADGMGGYGGGREASLTAVSSIREFFERSRACGPAEWPVVAGHAGDLNGERLVSAVRFAHNQIRQRIRTEDLPAETGTTVVALHYAPPHVYVANVGDSRCYSFQDGACRQVTRDHTVVSELLDRYGRGAARLIDLESYQHVLTRALGGSSQGELEVDLNLVRGQPGDTFLLCSDGLTLHVTDQELTAHATSGDDPEVVCRKLIDLANARGGQDNITALVFKVPCDGEDLDDDEPTEEFCIVDDDDPDMIDSVPD